MKLNLYTYFWGEEFKKLFTEYCYKSMMQEGNIPSLLKRGVEVTWDIVTDTNIEIDNPIVNVQKMNKVNPNAKNESINTSFREMIAKSSKNKTTTAIISPDYIVGDKTLYNAFRLLEGRKDGCISVAHPRVEWEKIDGYKPMSNPELVKYAFDYAHVCLHGSFDNNPINNTWAGIAIRQIDDKTYSVIHNLATPFICQFNQSDVDFFNRTHYAHFDRTFTKKLLEEKRIKLVGSSDVCFFVEITKAQHNPEKCESKNGVQMLNNDKEIAGENHYNQFYVTWRGE